MAEFNDKEFLEYIIKELVDYPDDVRVDRKVDEMGVLLTLHVHPDDMGQVIGRGGNTARALRTLLRILGMKSHARVNLKIEEPEGRRKESPKEEPQKEEPQEESSPEPEESEETDLDDLEL